MWPSARIAGPARYRPKVDRVMRWQMIEGCKASAALQIRSPDERRDIRALPPPMMPASRDSPNIRPGMMSRDFASLIRASAAAPSRLPKRLVYLAPSICRRKAHVPQLDVIQCGENARSLLLASHSASSPAHRFRDADANARPLFTFVFTQAAVFAVQSRGDSFRWSDAARAMSADVMILAPVLCEYRSVGSLDRTVPHHIRRDTPLIAVDFEILVAV